MAANELKASSGRAFVWSFADRGGTQVFQFLVQIWISRILLPRDYGLMGVVMSIVVIAQVISESGLNISLIRKPDVSDTEYSTVFWFNIFFGAFVMVLIVLSSPLLGTFFQEPDLPLLLTSASALLIMNATMIVHKVIYIKDLDFKTQFYRNIVSVIISGVLGIVLAELGFGVLSLVFMLLARSFINAIYYWIFAKWTPQFSFSFSELKGLFSFGSRITLSLLLSSLAESLSSFIIGKRYSIQELGLYSQAVKWQKLPVATFGSAISSVFLPSSAKIEDDDARKRAYQKVLIMFSILMFSLMGLLAVSAQSMIVLLIGSQWLESGLYLSILCIAGAFYPANLILVEILKSQGRSDLFLRVEIIKQVLLVLIMIVLSNFSVLFWVCGLSLFGAVSVFINAHFQQKVINLNYGVISKTLGKHLVLTVIPVSIVLIVRSFLNSSPLLDLIQSQVIFIGTTILLVSAFARKEFFELKHLIASISFRK